MHIEKRLIDGVERDVEIEDYPGEHKDRERDRRNVAHADRVASQLAKNKDFIAAIAQTIIYRMSEKEFVADVAKEIMNAPINPAGDK